jgi:hypothetical protein
VALLLRGTEGSNLACSRAKPSELQTKRPGSRGTRGKWIWPLFTQGSVETVNTPRVEAFYWAAITFSQTLGTALGDWMADSTGLGYEGGALVFAVGLAILAAASYWTTVSRVFLFWGHSS